LWKNYVYDMNRLSYISNQEYPQIKSIRTMKKTIRAFILSTGLSVILLGTGFGQLADVSKMLSGGVNDAELMLTEYLRPLANSLGANLNGGWYNSAKVHGTLGFDVTFTVSAAIAPDDALLYDLSTLVLDAVMPSDPIAPTFSGGKGLGPPIRYDVLGTEVLSYDHPGGVNLKWLPSPMINAGVGLPKGFEIIGRWMPTVKIKDIGSAGLWGIGVKHDIGQWIPFVKRVPVLDFTLHYGYTNLNLNTDLTTLTPELMGAEDRTTNADWEGQNFDLVTQGHTANFLVGATLPVVAFYGGIGISTTKSNLKMNGYYPIPTIDPNDPLNLIVTDESATQDPIDIEIKNSDGSVTAPRFNAGMRFKFTVITLHFDYTYANYSVLTVGFGVSLR
jgi:hypothetical protein